jgi:acetyl-CoA acetyltransferase
MTRRAVIIGVGETQYTKRGRQAARGELGLACEAIRSAAQDAGWPVHGIDGLISFGAEAGLPGLIQRGLKLASLNVSAQAWHPGGGANCGAIAMAAGLIEAGRAKCIAVFRAICQSDDQRFGQSHGYRALESLNRPYGLTAPAPMIALAAQRYRHIHQLPDDFMAGVSIQQRACANSNTKAVMHEHALSSETYLRSRMIAEPLRLFDCCLETDGAAAILIASSDIAGGCAKQGVDILASGIGGHAEWGFGILNGYDAPDADYLTGNSAALAKKLFHEAGIEAKDIDVAGLYDGFSYHVLLALEDYGFCERGAASSFVERRVLPFNTSGGSLSEAYVHGMNLVTEVVRQLRGESRCQVAKARFALVTGAAAEGPTSGAILSVA